MNRNLFLGIGFLIWLVATTIFRLWGHFFFLPENTLAMLVLYIVAGGGMFTVALWLFRWQKLSDGGRFLAAILLVLPGMILDAAVTEFFSLVYPNLPPNAAGSFGAWLLWVYAFVLVASLLPHQNGG